MVRFLLALSDSKHLLKIYHYLPIRGHSFLSCDRDFSGLKLVLRRYDRIYLPADNEQMIKDSRKIGPFSVSTITFEDIWELPEWWPQILQGKLQSNSVTPSYVTTRNLIDGFLV